MLLSNFLRKDYDVTTKADGLDGLSWLGQGNLPDLIILDMMLPKLNGIDFLINIRNSGFFGQIPIIVLSGEDKAKFKSACFQLGVSGYLTKPFNPLQLKTKINDAISQYQIMLSEF